MLSEAKRNVALNAGGYLGLAVGVGLAVGDLQAFDVTCKWAVQPW